VTTPADGTRPDALRRLLPLAGRPRRLDIAGPGRIEAGNNTRARQTSSRNSRLAGLREKAGSSPKSAEALRFMVNTSATRTSTRRQAVSDVRKMMTNCAMTGARSPSWKARARKPRPPDRLSESRGRRGLRLQSTRAGLTNWLREITTPCGGKIARFRTGQRSRHMLRRFRNRPTPAPLRIRPRMRHPERNLDHPARDLLNKRKRNSTA
jgi:hypothetical protein